MGNPSDDNSLCRVASGKGTPFIQISSMMERLDPLGYHCGFKELPDHRSLEGGFRIVKAQEESGYRRVQKVEFRAFDDTFAEILEIRKRSGVYS